MDSIISFNNANYTINDNEIYSLIYIGNYEGSEMGHQFDGTSSPYLAQLAQPAHCTTINQDDVIRLPILIHYFFKITLLRVVIQNYTTLDCS